jgi:hypothetical protein
LALFFFPGIGGALALLDGLVVRAHVAEANAGAAPEPVFRVLALPIIHALVFAYVAYAPVVERWAASKLPHSRVSARVIVVVACIVAYILAALVSL